MSAVLEKSAVKARLDVAAVLNYTRKTAVRPVNYTYDPPPGIPRNSGEIDPHTVTVHDARRVEDRGVHLDCSVIEAGGQLMIARGLGEIRARLSF